MNLQIFFGLLCIWSTTAMGMQNTTQNHLTINQLPLEILEIIFQDVTKDNFLLHHIARLTLLTPQMYDKIAEHYADHLPFYPKQENIDAIISTNFATTCTASLSTAIFQENIRRALNAYIVDYPFGMYQNALDSGQDDLFANNLDDQILKSSIGILNNVPFHNLDNHISALPHQDKHILYKELGVYIAFIKRIQAYIKKKQSKLLHTGYTYLGYHFDPESAHPPVALIIASALTCIVYYYFMICTVCPDIAPCVTHESISEPPSPSSSLLNYAAILPGLPVVHVVIILAIKKIIGRHNHEPLIKQLTKLSNTYKRLHQAVHKQL